MITLPGKGNLKSLPLLAGRLSKSETETLVDPVVVKTLAAGDDGGTKEVVELGFLLTLRGALGLYRSLGFVVSKAALTRLELTDTVAIFFFNSIPRLFFFFFFFFLFYFFFFFFFDAARSIPTAIAAGATLAVTSALIDSGGQTTRVDNGREYYPYTPVEKRAQAES